MLKNDTSIFAAFPGTGKTYIVEKMGINSIEVEYWRYKDNGLDREYIEDVKKHFGNIEYIFISTDPQGLKLLHNEGLSITLIYPQNELRGEYLDRYISRDSSPDFIGAFMKYWDVWIDQLKEQPGNHIILKVGQYLKDVLPTTEPVEEKEDELWSEIFNQYNLWDCFGVKDDPISELKSKFSISKKI